MPNSKSIGLLRPGERSQWVRLRTLSGLRWVAIAGQTIAVGVAYFQFGLALPLGLCMAAIGLSVIANLLAIFLYPENKRLSEGEAMLMLLFDAAQLAFLLSLTGGLNNPFSLLILTPVTISATALRLRPTLVLGLFSVVAATVLAFLHIPLRELGGEAQRLPPTFLFGFWLAIVIGVGFLAFYASRVAAEISSMSDALLATQMALAREQKLTDLGGVVAATAHELGTPLATIKLVSGELLEELADQDDLREDALLIREQADRCAAILRSMGRAGKDDKKLHVMPFAEVITDAAQPHQDRGKHLHFDLEARDVQDAKEPRIFRRPEIIHGLRNLIQNAVDFADNNVWIDAFWSDSKIGVRISDDGKGYAPQIIGRIGDPFVRRRRTDTTLRPEYEGMGLGLFISKTLLERSGAEMTFENGRDPRRPLAGQSERKGAIVEVLWPRNLIEASPESELGALGENQKF